MTGYQQFVNFLLQAGSKAEEVVSIPPEYPDILRAGTDYASLLQHPGYKRLLDDLARHADLQLGNMRASESSDPVIIKGLRDRWRMTEDLLKFIQVRIAEAIDSRRQVLEEIGSKFGVSPEEAELGGVGLDLNDTDDEYKIRAFMGSQGDPDLDEYHG